MFLSWTLSKISQWSIQKWNLWSQTWSKMFLSCGRSLWSRIWKIWTRTYIWMLAPRWNWIVTMPRFVYFRYLLTVLYIWSRVCLHFPGNLVPHLNPTSIACCSDEDYCNSVLKPHYKISVDSHLENSNNSGDFFGIGIDSTTAYILLITFVICLLLAVISIVCYYRKVKKEEKNQKKKFGQR